MRKYRKREHVENYLRSTYVGNPLFEDVFLYHNSLPECDFNEIDTSTVFLNKKVDFPLIINAMTGGSEFAEGINLSLARVAKEFNIPMAVGSQTIVFEDKDARKSFECVRETLGDGIVLSNLSGHATVDEAKYAIDMIKADGIQIHLNPAQELAMEEGDRGFKGIIKNISKIVEGVDVPVIVKEVGFGISKDVAVKLYDAGVRYIDVSGFGGTNFFEVENLRVPSNDLSELYGWGIPTAMSLIEVNSLGYKDLNMISSGGIKNSLELVKSIVLGASMTAISGEILTYLIHGGYEYTMQYISNIIYKSKVTMLLTGAKNISELSRVNYRVTGKLRELVDYDK
ncbi:MULTISPECIES: type 2 isopentenyl-diphosphate Delta-isomerase [Peptoniphilus]|uniref:type 2 isopentenyl-diphosphate Delta-isomerase n=1 Tax=Peptoniphilus TaxID=162289 RepID=UPI0001DA9A14|nr:MULTISPECIES: type 2 isopentenyl-diphosphate Delta-isomerase [Peptoniphilus]EFI41838.1 isopentenyl-diphosphate delta-isomerase, type 2 [Peptoniphilus sp. oral taxon 386 str. F0131]